MEKCTYCVQMVERAKIRHKSRLMKEHPGQPSTSIHVTAQDMLLPDGAAQTACQLACPMGAITFGNVLDPAAAVFPRQVPAAPPGSPLLPGHVSRHGLPGSGKKPQSGHGEIKCPARKLIKTALP